MRIALARNLSECTETVWIAWQMSKLFAESWDANVFCQERTQLFKLSGDLHDQVELTETGWSLVENKARPQQSGREPSARTAPPRNQSTAHESHTPEPDPARSEPYANHRSPPTQPSRDSMQLNQVQQSRKSKPMIASLSAPDVWACLGSLRSTRSPHLDIRVADMKHASSLSNIPITLTRICNA